jgi:hypothetical protein
MYRIRSLIKSIFFITIPTLLIVFIILELFFKFIIPASNWPQTFFDEKDKMYYPSNGRVKTGLFTAGRFAEIRARWCINNMYWNFPLDYYPAGDKKLIAIIGDSYVEALQVDIDKSSSFLLRSKVLPDYEVYAFGKGGAMFSQYLHISRYVRKYFNPEIFIFHICDNDFHDSFLGLQRVVPSQYLRIGFDKNGLISEIEPSATKYHQRYSVYLNVLSKSALFRYIYFNLRGINIFYNILNMAFSRDLRHDLLESKDKVMEQAINYLASAIRKENLGKRIIFVFDAQRQDIYRNSLEGSGSLWLRDMMANVCRKNNIEYVDLNIYMKRDFEKYNRKFNSNIDGHWNEYGHEVVANVLFEHLFNGKGRKE